MSISDKWIWLNHISRRVRQDSVDIIDWFGDLGFPQIHNTKVGRFARQTKASKVKNPTNGEKE
jgi:hypothetical protein